MAIRQVTAKDNTAIEVLTHSLEQHRDFLFDTIFDDFPYRAAEFRKMAAEMNDDELNHALSEARKMANVKIDRLEAIEDMLKQLK